MEGRFPGVAGGGSGGEPNSRESWSQARLCRPVLKLGGDMRGSKEVLPAWVGTDSLETERVSLRNHSAQTPTDLTFSEKLGRDKNSNDKTGIKVASSPCNPNSCKSKNTVWTGRGG